MSKEKSYINKREYSFNNIIANKPLLPIAFSDESKPLEILKKTKILLNKTEDYNDFLIKFYKSKKTKIKSPRNSSRKTIYRFPGKLKNKKYYKKRKKI